MNLGKTNSGERHLNIMKHDIHFKENTEHTWIIHCSIKAVVNWYV